MEETFRRGRIAGIRVGINWSVLVIFALIAYGLAGQYLPRVYPREGVAAYVVAGVTAAVVFVASLLAHEIAHALVAWRNGVSVEGITLWLFGGVARLSGEAPSPGAEVRIAGVGPLVSLVLGLGFGAAAAIAAAAGVSGLALAALEWLGGVNIALAVFNVVPAAPLDGGRLLRAVVWWRTGDRRKATAVASRAGRAGRGHGEAGHERPGGHGRRIDLGRGFPVRQPAHLPAFGVSRDRRGGRPGRAGDAEPAQADSGG